ncbi:MAG: Gram-negative bacterial TonB protein C-terminal, partial [Verrucomicrobiaceae bacterium]|nr:Gram-negative bacterial TonB protein C-terminal [Verrucomicrobiaceae bacterium]
PEDYRKANMEAFFRVVIVIGVDGNVRAAAAVENIGPSVTQPAVDCVKEWKFQPAKVNGLPAEYLVVVPFKFNLLRINPRRR